MSKDKIIKQVEYYFGDINLPRDKFLLECQKSDDGWISLETMLKFNRLAQITTNIDEIAKALRDSSLMEVAEDNKKIRRRLEFPLPDNNLEYWQEIKSRTIYVKGFDEDTTLDDIQSFLEPYGAIKNVIMRRTKGAHIFKGSIFVTFKDKDEAKAFLDNSNVIKYKENDLVKLFQDTYWANKQKEVKEKRKAEQKLKKKQKNVEEQDQKSRIVQTTFVKGALLKVTGFPPKLRADQIKDFFRKYGDPAYTTTADDNSVTIRFNSETENIAKEVWDKAVKGSADGKTVVFEFNDKDYSLNGAMLEGDEEQKYWLEFQKSKIARLEQMEKMKSQRCKGGRGGGKNNNNNKNNRKRPAIPNEGDENSAPKKNSHIKFNEDNENEEAKNENEDEQIDKIQNN